MKHKLKSRQVDTLGPGRHGDGGGLWLQVTSNGTRSWLLRYTLDGRARHMGLGPASGKNLAEARQQAERWRSVLAAGQDPIAVRDAERKETAGVRVTGRAGEPTFTRVAASYIRNHRREYRNKKHARQWARTLKTYARPVLGDRLVSEITTDDVLAALQPIWSRIPETAKRTQNRIEKVLDYAAALGHRDQLNPARWRGHLQHLLPAPTKIKKLRNMPAMPYDQVPGFYAELTQVPGMAARALRLLILSGCRTGEVLAATWPEVDLEGAVWTIPGERMKGGREHRVPLTSPAVEILESTPHLVGNPHLFPGQRHGKPLSNMAMLQVMRSMGFGVGGTHGDYVPHGFRSTLRDWLEEQTATPHVVAEMCLAHQVDSALVRTYRRTDLFDQRAEAMGLWAAFVTSAAKVTPLDRLPSERRFTGT